MTVSNERSNFKILFAVSLFACGILQAATPAFNGQFKRRAKSDEDQSDAGSHIIYVSPVPESKYITPRSNIIIHSDENVSPSTIQDNLFKVVGSSSGEHDGKVILSDDQQTVLFQPQTPFTLGETVTVSMAHPLSSIGGDSILFRPFSFTISGSDLNADKALIAQFGHGIQKIPVAAAQTQSHVDQTGSITMETQLKNELEGLPADFPALTITQSDSPSPGYIFLATNVQPNSYGNYLIIADNNGNPVFYRKPGQGSIFDFKIQPAGVLTYLTDSTNTYYVMNTSLQVIDSITAGNGYVTDNHELQILPDGNIFLLADDYEQIDMSEIVLGGNPDATVEEEVIQELDKNKNVIFQWRTIDHFNITDNIGQDLTQPTIDAFHANAIDIDQDGNILLSCRYLSEVTKINLETGDIIWRLGGNNNQFEFINDPIGFSYQHDIRRLSNGDITLMDNGNMHTPQFSRAVEYKLDEVNKTATLVWQFRHDPDVYDSYMGNVQRLANGNTIIGWGGAETPAVTEVRPDGSTALEMTFPYADEQLALSYRAFRFPFLFITSPTANDTARAGDTTTFRWNSSGVDSVEIDYSTDVGNSWSNVAVNYPAGADSIVFSVPPQIGSSLQFRVIQSDLVDSGVTFFSGNISVVGGATDTKQTANPYSYSLSNNYPNPFNPSTTINYEIAANSFVTLKVYDVLGRGVATLVNETESPGQYSVKFDGSKFASGVYFYRLASSSGFVQVKKMVLEK